MRFYYSFGRSTPRFYREGCPTANEICVSLQFWAIDTTFLPRGLPDGNQNVRFTTVLSDRHHVCSERVDREKMKFAFRYSFGRSTPRFYREGSPDGNQNVRFTTVLSDRHHVCSERVDREKMKFAFRYSFGRSTTRF